MARAEGGRLTKLTPHCWHRSVLLSRWQLLPLFPTAIVSPHRTPHSANPPSPPLCGCFLLEDTHHVAMASVVIASMDLIHSMYSTPLACSILRLSSLSQGLEERPRELEVQSNWSPWNNQHPCLSLGRCSAGRIYLLWCGFAIQCRNINALRYIKHASWIFFFFLLPIYLCIAALKSKHNCCHTWWFFFSGHICTWLPVFSQKETTDTHHRGRKD